MGSVLAATLPAAGRLSAAAAAAAGVGHSGCCRSIRRRRRRRRLGETGGGGGDDYGAGLDWVEAPVAVAASGLDGFWPGMAD